MSHQVIADITHNITILNMTIVQRFGLTTAAVFGRIQMYCQLEDGVCTASMETIGGELSIDRATANRHAQRLCEAGYLEDLTPGLRNHPHTYRDTGLAGVTITIAGYAGQPAGVANCNTGDSKCNTRKNGSKSGVAKYNTTKKSGVANCNTDPVGDSNCNTESSGVAINHMNNVVVVNTSLNIEMNQQQQAARNALVAAGVRSKKAQALATTRSPEEIALALDVYAFSRRQGKADRQGWLITYLEERWSPPDDYVPAAERCPECWRSLTDHSENCSRRESKYARDSYLCPYCHTSPCTCDEEEDLIPASGQAEVTR